jgi:hypothetical protein
MRQLRDRRSGARGRARGRFLLPLLALALSAGAGRAGEIRGRILVSDRTDKPGFGLTISAIPWETPGEEARRAMKGGESPKPVASATSGADGSFVLMVPPAEPGGERLFRVRAEGAGIVPVLFEGVYDAAETDDLGEHTLPHGEGLSGIAVDASGKPLAGAAVSLEPGVAGGDDLAYRVVTRTAVTGEDGKFQFDEASATGNRITIEEAGLAPALQTGLRAGAIPRPIAVAAGGPVSGVVLGGNKKPAAGALVRLESSKATTRWVETDAEGRFTIPHAPDGRGAIVVDAGEAGWGSRPDVKLPLGEGKLITITLALPASLDGKVVDDKTGRVVPRAKVFVRANGFARLTRTGPDGLYHLKGIPPQAYRLAVDEARYVPWMKPDLALAPGEAKHLDIAVTLGATMLGKVVDENGAPVPAARGSLIRGGENAIAGIRRMLRVGGGETTAFRTRADGTFKATRLAPGENQRLFVSHADFERATLAGMSLPSGGTKLNVAIVMHRGATISGAVKDANNLPVQDVEVEVDPSVNFRAGAGGMIANFARIGGASTRPKTKTAVDGTFHITGISLGEYALILKKPGFATERVDPVKVTDKGAEPVAVTLGPGASIAGIVRRKSGDGAEGFMVRVAGGRGGGGRGGGGGGGGGLLGGMGTDLATASDGLFTIDGLKPGQAYDLSVFGGAGLGPQKRGVVAPATNVEMVVAGTGRIAGTALDARSGQPLKNFSVSFEPDRGGGAIIRIVARGAGAQTGIGQKREFNTDDGSFTLEDVPAGTWTVVVEAKGYQPARVANLLVEENGVKDGVEVRATPGMVLKGHVTDARSGRPVANANITYQATDSGGGPGGGFGGRGGAISGLDPSQDITSDADGHFEIEGIPTGKVKVTAKNPDYTDGSEVADVKDTGGTVEIKLTGGGSASGIVALGSQPLPNAEVALAGAGDAGFGRILGGSQTTTSDGQGHFEFDHLGAGRYTVSAGLNGQSSNLTDFVLQAGDSKNDIVLSLSGGSTIQGAVSGLPDNWKNGTTVTANGAQAFVASTKVGGDGTFQITNVPAGPVTLRAQAGDGLGDSRSATKLVTASDDVPVLPAEIVFEVGFNLTGHVTQAGQPTANVMVLASLQGGGGRQATTRTDSSGAYTLQGLQEGSYTVTATSDPLAGSGAQVRQTISLTSDQNLDLTFPTARVSGVVNDADTKQPLSNATISLAAAAGTGTPMQRMATTDSNGHFQFTDVPPQSYTLNAQMTDYQFDNRTITAADDGSTDNLSIDLVHGQGIGIIARDGLYGVPMRSLSARALDGNKNAVFQGTIALDSTGSGEIPSLQPGGYALFVNASGYATLYIPSVTAPSQQPLPVSLTPGGSADISVGPKSFVNGIMRGTLKNSSGIPYPYTLFNTDGRIAITADATGQTGFRRLSNLAPGSYILTLDNGGGTSFNISEGSITPVPLP